MATAIINNDIQRRNIIRNIVNNIYDVQSLRIMQSNRMNAALNPDRLNPEAAKPVDKEKADKERDTFTSKLVNEYKIIDSVYGDLSRSPASAEKILRIAQEKNGIQFITSYMAYTSVKAYMDTLAIEQSYIKTVTREVEDHPMWDRFFKDVKGCGPLMAAVCIAYLDPTKARHASSFWKYAGLDVAPDKDGNMVGRNRSEAHLVESTYIDKKTGEEKTKMGLSFNPFLKTKLVGVLGSSFLRAGKDAKYAKIYYDYKHRKECTPTAEDVRPIVIHRQATRYAVKMFLKDLWIEWRTYLGLPVSDDYAVAKLGMRPHGT